MAVEVKFQADVSAAVQSIKQLEKANAEAAKSGNADASALDRGRMAQDALNRAKAVRDAAQAAKEETEAQIKLQAAHLATAKAAAKGADASTQSGKERLKNLQTQQEAMDALIAKAKKLKATVQDGDSLVGRAQNARRDTMQSVSKAAQTIRRRIEQRVVVRDETSRGFMSIQRTARYYALRIKRQFRDLKIGISGAFSGLKGLKGFGPLAVVGAAVAGLKATIDKIPDLSNLAKHARSLGMTGKQLQVLKYACDSAGISFDSFEGATSKVTRTIEQASGGAAEAQKKLAMLGLTAADFAGLNSYEKLQRVAAAINDLGDHGKKTAAAMAFFEESGGKMLDMLSGIVDAEERFKQTGGLIDDAALAAAERYNQLIVDIGNNITAGIMNSGVVEWLAALAEGAKNLLSGFGGNSDVRSSISLAQKEGWISQKDADRLSGAALFYKPGQGGIHREIDELLERVAEFNEIREGLAKIDAMLDEAAKRSAARKQAEEQTAKEIAALDKQLQDLGKINRGPQTREEFIQQEMEKAQKAAPSQFESRKAEIEKAAGDKFDREQREAEQQEAARREMASLEEEINMARERARMTEYQGDSLRRIGGTIGGTSGVDRYKQEMIRRADTQLKTLQGIYERMDQIKRDNPHVFK